MKKITPSRDVPKFGLKAGESYVVTERTAGYSLLMTATEVQTIKPKPFTIGRAPFGARVAVVREGGLGDLIFLTPWLRAIMEARPDIKIDVVTWPKYFPALQEDSNISNLVAYPLTLSHYEQYNEILWLEDFVESNPGEHPVDTLSRMTGIEIQDKKFRYTVTDTEYQEALSRISKKGLPRIGVQIYASSPARTYPREMIQSIVYFLSQKNEVVLFAEKGTIDADEDSNVVNLANATPPLNFREACAILKTCDAAIVPDSSLCHIAASLSIPTIALFAAFPAETRVRYSPSVKALTVTGGCAPCLHHDNGFDRFPEGQMCSRSGKCEALATIKPIRIVHEVEYILGQRLTSRDGWNHQSPCDSLDSV